MFSDADIHAWLDTNTYASPSIVTPYIQSAEDKVLHYRVQVQRAGRAGQSSLIQGGTVNALAKTPASLGSFAITVDKEDACSITLTLIHAGAKVGAYQFECPR